MKIAFSDSVVTPHQQAVADRLEATLIPKVRYDRTVRPSEGNGPSVVFVIRSRIPDVSVRLIVYQDSFHVEANGAGMSIELEPPESYKEWTEAVLEATRALISGPLRVRVRRTALLRRSVGAIFLPCDRGPCWNGDLAAIRGAGEEFTFPDWYERASVG